MTKQEYDAMARQRLNEFIKDNYNTEPSPKEYAVLLNLMLTGILIGMDLIILRDALKAKESS